jgi:hypothetical protein
MAAWAEEQARPHPPVAPPTTVAARSLPVGPMGGGGTMLSNGADRIPVPAGGPAGAGRGLDAYRSLPVPIAGRPPLARTLLARSTTTP